MQPKPSVAALSDAIIADAYCYKTGHYCGLHGARIQYPQSLQL